MGLLCAGGGGAGWAHRPSMHSVPCATPQQSLAAAHLSLRLEHAGGCALHTKPAPLLSQAGDLGAISFAKKGLRVKITAGEDEENKTR